jgi:hypothetical protein
MIMKRFSVALGLTIGLLCVLSHLAWAQEAKQPKLVIKQPLFDAGEIDEGNVIKHTFLVSNTGNGTLEIKDVRPG